MGGGGEEEEGRGGRGIRRRIMERFHGESFTLLQHILEDGFVLDPTQRVVALLARAPVGAHHLPRLCRCGRSARLRTSSILSEAQSEGPVFVQIQFVRGEGDLLLFTTAAPRRGLADLEHKDPRHRGDVPRADIGLRDEGRGRVAGRGNRSIFSVYEQRSCREAARKWECHPREIPHGREIGARTPQPVSTDLYRCLVENINPKRQLEGQQLALSITIIGGGGDQ